MQVLYVNLTSCTLNQTSLPYYMFCVVQDLGKKKKPNLRIKGNGKETVSE